MENNFCYVYICMVYVPHTLILKSWNLATQCIYVLHVIPKTMIISINNINHLVFVMEMQCVPCGVGNLFLNIYLSLRLQRIIRVQ
jgi:hypothetical protein